jgi:hypothetical protein
VKADCIAARFADRLWQLVKIKTRLGLPGRVKSGESIICNLGEAEIQRVTGLRFLPASRLPAICLHQTFRYLVLPDGVIQVKPKVGQSPRSVMACAVYVEIGE